MADYFDEEIAKEMDDEFDEKEELDDGIENDYLTCTTCGAIIEDKEKAIKKEEYGDVYFFCSEECAEDFN